MCLLCSGMFKKRLLFEVFELFKFEGMQGAKVKFRGRNLQSHMTAKVMELGGNVYNQIPGLND